MMKKISFLKLRYFAIFLSSFLVFSLWSVTFYRGGFNVGIDFKSGLDIVLLFSPSNDELSASIIHQKLDQFKGIQVREAENNQFILRIAAKNEKNFQQETEEIILKTLRNNYDNIQILSSDFVGASYSSSTLKKSLLVIIGTILAIILYLWMRFELNYAISAVLCTLHDAIIMIGFIGAAQFEINITAVAAILTIIGYSLNDTLVTFDRIRENSIKSISQYSNISGVIESSITQTLNRTLITSITTLLAVLPITLISKSNNIRWFSIEIFVGIIVGTYSSIFIAGMLLNFFHNFSKDINKKISKTALQDTLVKKKKESSNTKTNLA